MTVSELIGKLICLKGDLPVVIMDSKDRCYILLSSDEVNVKRLALRDDEHLDALALGSMERD